MQTYWDKSKYTYENSTYDKWQQIEINLWVQCWVKQGKILNEN